MTTPKERRRAVLETRQFLIFLTQPSREADVPEDIRYQAEALLRHYPYATDMDIAELAYLDWLKEDKRKRLTDINPLLEKMVEHAEPVLIAIAVGFVCVSVSLSEFLCKRGHEIMPKGMFHDRRNDYYKA